MVAERLATERTLMQKRMATSIVSLALAALMLTGGSARGGSSQAKERAAATPSPEEIRALVERVIANQHRSDAALEEYERIEHRQARRRGKDTALTEDRTFRVVPTGTGMARVTLEENGRPVDATLYRKQLRNLEQALLWALEPGESRQKQRIEKRLRRTRERTEMVDAVRDAFRFSWLGREARDGRVLAKLALDPSPAFKPASRNAAVLSHGHATAWVDESSGQLARIEVEIVRDISFGGGLLGKVYRGGRFVMEQTEVAAGVWLPTRYQYDFEGRKFLFGFEFHETTLAGRYRRIGTPREALAVIRGELSNTQPVSSARESLPDL